MPDPAQPAEKRDPVFDFALSQNRNPKASDKFPLKTEPHLRVTSEFLRRCSSLKITRDGILLYQYMLLRSAPNKIKRSQHAELYGEVIQKGEFFENKLRVAAALGKGQIKDKSKINWFGRTVKQLEDLGLVKQIHKGHRGYNATYIVYDVRVLRRSHD